MLNINGGIARGIRLDAPDEDWAVRPTLGRSREALFGSISQRLPGSTVLDLFSGSGALGLEAASRRASRAVMVEKERRHFDLVCRNIEKVRKSGVTAELLPLCGDALDLALYRQAASEADFIFADPPYAVSEKCLSSLPEEWFHAFPGAELYWEVPDVPGSLGALGAVLSGRGVSWKPRKFGGTEFIVAKLG